MAMVEDQSAAEGKKVSVALDLLPIGKIGKLAPSSHQEPARDECINKSRSYSDGEDAT